MNISAVLGVSAADVIDAISNSKLSSFTELALAFGQHHQSPVNVAVHMVTTPLGLIGALALLRGFTKGSGASLVLCFLYLLTLLPLVPIGVFAGTALLCGLVAILARYVRSTTLALTLILLGYLLQDLSHLATNETTFQSTYSAGGQIDILNLSYWAKMFTEHCYYLLPLCVNLVLPSMVVPEVLKQLAMPLPDQMLNVHTFAYYLVPLFVIAFGSYCIDSKNAFSFFPGSPYFSRVLQCNIAKTEQGKTDLRRVRDWAMKHMPSKEKSSHWWFGDLGPEEKEAFDRCARSSVVAGMFRSLFGERHYCIDVVEGMNEVYISGPPRADEALNSDHVFFQRHVDGPWGFIPYVSVYRCIVGMDRNLVYTTHFPIANVSNNALEGDVLAFDFNREVHYITRDESKQADSDDFRVVLKLHYVVYPRILRPLGWLMHSLNMRYNLVFRALFLKTINPSTLYEHFLAWNVVFNTALFDFIETFFGQRSLYYLLFAASVWYVTGSYEVFFALTSFVHYFRYISTYYFRKDIDFGSFKRDVLLFKTLAFSQLIYMYLFPASGHFSLDWVSIGMIVSGYSVSVMATNALGIDRTYFAAELGLVPHKWITQFPYGYIPHPMIVSQIWALLGFYKAQHLREASPYVVPVHITLYLVHMFQEHFNIYSRPSHEP